MPGLSVPNHKAPLENPTLHPKATNLLPTNSDFTNQFVADT